MLRLPRHYNYENLYEAAWTRCVYDIILSMPELFPLDLDDYEVFTTLQLGQFMEITALSHYPGSHKPDFPAADELAP